MRGDVRCPIHAPRPPVRPARVLEYTDFRNFIAVIAKARGACENSGHAASDHFVETNEMVGIGSGAQRPVEDWKFSRYASYGQFASVGKQLHNRPARLATQGGGLRLNVWCIQL